jgi:hypothetical protein
MVTGATIHTENGLHMRARRRVASPSVAAATGLNGHAHHSHTHSHAASSDHAAHEEQALHLAGVHVNGHAHAVSAAEQGGCPF